MVLAVFTQTLLRHGSQEPFSLVLTTSHRAKLPAQASNVVGPFTSTVVLVIDGTGGLSLDDMAGRRATFRWMPSRPRPSGSRRARHSR